MILPDDVVGELRAINPSGADWLIDRLGQHGLFESTVREVAAAANIGELEAERLLDVLYAHTLLHRRAAGECPECSGAIDLDAEICPTCRFTVVSQPKQIYVYSVQQPQGRDVRWMLLIHGMSTLGRWQEQFSWRAALVHGRSIPVFSFKYGRLRPGVLFTFRRRQLVRRVTSAIRELSGAADAARLGGPPDVIAHSFGTWLIVQALLQERDVKIGRLILTGSIVPPSFDWARIGGQVDAVMNHRGTRDRVVPFAAYFIPESGPSGRRGFNPGNGARDRSAKGWGHSTFFRKDGLPRAFHEVWSPFLVDPVLRDDTPRQDGRVWAPPPRLLRARLARWAAIAALLAFTAVFALVLLTGFATLFL